MSERFSGREFRPSKFYLAEMNKSLGAENADLRARAERAERQAEALAKALEAAVDLAIWMSGADAFSPAGEAHDGWVEGRPTIEQARAALAAYRSGSC